MPMYEYECSACEHVTETLRPMAQADDAIACEKCGSKKTHRLHSVFAAGSSHSHAMPASPCGQCGDPGGACPFRNN